MPIAVSTSRPIVPALESANVGVLVQSATEGRLVDVVGHLEGWKFRRVVHHAVEYNFPLTGTLRTVQPSSAAGEIWIPWVSHPRAKQIGIIIGCQSHTTSGSPFIKATLYKRTAPTPVVIDAFGCEWVPGSGTLHDGRTGLAGGGYEYKLRYVTTGARAMGSGAIAGTTAPRTLNVDSSAGDPLAVKLEFQSVRIFSVTVFERHELTVG